jgi:predicted PurR-regulated permease PerM
MKTATAAPATTSDRLTTVLSYGAILLLGYLVFRIFEPFLVPLAWSAILAIFFYSLYQRLLVRMTANRAAILCTLGVTLLLIVPALVILFFTAREALDATARLQTALLIHGQGPDQGFVVDLESWLRKQLPNSMRSMDLAAPVQQAIEKTGSFIAASIGGILKNFANFFVDLFLLIFALFFMFRDGQGVVRAIRHLFPFDEDIQEEMITESKELIFASVAVALVIAVIQGVLGGLAFEITGISTPIFWGVVIAFFSLVPVVGSALIWFPGAGYLFFTGHWGKALVIVAVCLGVSTIADNIVRPVLLSNRTRLNDLLLFIGVIGGLEVFGLVGLVAGPTIVAAAVGVFRVHMERREGLGAPPA